jgi:uncharacterized protein (TIGR03067 family)
MIRPIAVAIAFAFSAFTVAAPVPKAIKKGSDLDGTWEWTELSVRGRKHDLIYKERWVISGEKLTLEYVDVGNGVPSSKGQPDFSLKKAEKVDNGVDFVTQGHNGRPPNIRPGLYELDGDTLKVCLSDFGGPRRPSRCEADKDNFFYMFKRVTTADK